MNDIQEMVESQFSWMEEPCSCGDVFSHPDGGDSQCRYCAGAIEMRDTMENLLAEVERLQGVCNSIAGTIIAGKKNHALALAIAEVPD